MRAKPSPTPTAIPSPTPRRGLPTGLSIDSATGKITGTIAATAPGVYAVSVTAHGPTRAPPRSESFAWTVSDTPPTTKGILAGQSYPDSTAGIAIDTAGGFTSPNDVPLTYRAAGLPAGLSIDPATGTITGQLDHEASATAPAWSGSGATLDGTYTVTVTADDGPGRHPSSRPSRSMPPTMRRPSSATTPDQHGQDGQAVSLDARQAFADPNSGDVLTFSATNLPQGLSIDPATGLISGTLADTASRAGPYSVQVIATDDKGAATTETFRWVGRRPGAAGDASARRPFDQRRHGGELRHQRRLHQSQRRGAGLQCHRPSKRPSRSIRRPASSPAR